MRKNNFLIFLFLTIGIAVFGQKDSAEVFLAIQTDSTYYIQIDNQVYKQTDRLILRKQLYQMKIWAPGYLLRDTVIDLRNKRQFAYKDVLRPNPEYANYKQQLKKHKNQIYWKYVLPITATLGAGTYTYLTFQEVNKLHDEAKIKLELYYNSPGFIQEIDSETGQTINVFYSTEQSKTDFEAARVNFKEAKQNYQIGLATTITAAAISSYFLIRLKHYKKSRPTYQSEQNPFELNGIGLDYSQNTPMIYLGFQF